MFRIHFVCSLVPQFRLWYAVTYVQTVQLGAVIFCVLILCFFVCVQRFFQILYSVVTIFYLGSYLWIKVARRLKNLVSSIKFHDA
jgi:hypothetical protein